MRVLRAGDVLVHQQGETIRRWVVKGTASTQPTRELYPRHGDIFTVDGHIYMFLADQGLVMYDSGIKITTVGQLRELIEDMADDRRVTGMLGGLITPKEVAVEV